MVAKTECGNLVVFSILRESKCSECNQELSKGNFLLKEGERGLCMSCADLDELMYLPSGDAALTRRARKYSPLWAVVVRFSRARGRFILQCVVAMFSEDFDLLPKGLFSELLNDSAGGESSYDLLGSLFRQMNSEAHARGGRFRDVSYFNGGLFSVIDPIDLRKDELLLLMDASSENWGKVAPPIFGTLFQSSMDRTERHAYGAHFTNEADIQKAVRPTIVRPWRDRIAQASTLKELRDLADALLSFRVLDPACGSGNFLYIAYRELVNVEMEILAKIHENFGDRAQKAVGTASLLSTRQFYGIDRDSFAIELAKVTLMLAKRVALAETRESWFAEHSDLPFEFGSALPLDNLDANIKCDDALFADWPAADVIIGNPPYQSKNKMQKEFGRVYLNRVRSRYPDVPGRADYCVHWFRRAHDQLPIGGRTGLVGANTIRQNYSREGGLDYIVRHGGTITEAAGTTSVLFRRALGNLRKPRATHDPFCPR